MESKEITLEPVLTEKEIRIFGELKLKLIKYHQQFATKQGVFDHHVDAYTYEKAIRHIGESCVKQFLIIYENEVCGFIEYEYTESPIDHEKIIFVHGLYIKEQFRDKHIGKYVVDQLKSLGFRIEWECYYDMPSNSFHKKTLKAKIIKTRYMLD